MNWSQRSNTPLKELKIEASKLENSKPEESYINICDLEQPSTSKILLKMEDFEEDEAIENDFRRFEINYLEKIISEASKWLQNCELVKQAVSKLYQMTVAAKMHEEKVSLLKKILKNIINFRFANS